MPTVFRHGLYVFVFFSSDHGEPPHVHVRHGVRIAKFWLDPVQLAKNRGFKQHELNEITRFVVEYQQILLEAWHDYFGS